MARYIELNALVAEIERQEKKNNESENVYDFGTEHALKSILSFLDTLKVKEVDIDKEIEQSFIDLDYHLDAYNRVENYFEENIDMIEYERIAKYFFELGLKAQKGE